MMRPVFSAQIASRVLRAARPGGGAVSAISQSVGRYFSFNGSLGADVQGRRAYHDPPEDFPDDTVCLFIQIVLLLTSRT
jgi:hypothetical protein